VATLTRTAATIRMKSQVKILAIGSSSTQGIGATAPQFTYPAQLSNDLNTPDAHITVDVRNAGIGGETIDQTLARLTRELDTYRPDLVLWQVGTNDAITGSSDPVVFQKSIEAGIKAIHTRRIDAILIDPQYYPTIPNTAVYEHYVDIIHTAAQNTKIDVFPRYKLMSAWNRLPGGVVPMLGPDHFHMGDRGYACLAELIADEITKSVTQTDGAAVAATPPSATPANAAGGRVVATKLGGIAAEKPAIQPATEMIQH